jgi:AP-3 complex subunit mu
MMDSGFPMTTEPNILKEIIVPPNLVSRVISVVTGGASNMGRILPSATSSNVRWRASGIKHANNEIYFDLMEEMDATVNRDGFLARCEVYGEVRATSRLSGMPDVTVTFTNPSILNDVSFHPCVRYKSWEANQKLSFVPPDGSFKLMSYRFISYVFRSSCLLVLLTPDSKKP